MNRKNRSIFEKVFIPYYDELTLFSISYVCLLFIITNASDISLDMHSISITDNIKDSIILSIFFIIIIFGFLLSLYHAFSDRKKTLIEKKLMLFFAAITCGFSGIWGGTYMLLNSKNILIVFPIWNIISGWILISSLRSNNLNEDNVSDENVHLGKVLLGLIIITGIFFLCYSFLKLNWATTFSICLVWVTTLNSTVNSLFIRERIKINQV